MSLPEQELSSFRLGPHMVVALRGDLTDDQVDACEQRLLTELDGTICQGVVLDVSGLLVVDSFVTRTIARMVSLIQLMGADAVVAGIRPAMAITLVELGVPVDDFPTALDVERGLELLEERHARPAFLGDTA